MRELLRKVHDPAELLDFTTEELAAAVLVVMKSRKKNPIAAPVNRDSPCSDLFMPGDPTLLTPVQIRDLQRKLDRSFQKALKWLESQELIESDEGYNGKNGIVTLTEQGEQCELQTDFQNIQRRSLLVPQMLHPEFHDAVYSAFHEGRFGDAVFAAFKRIEIEVHKKSKRPKEERGSDLMRAAFNPDNGPLTDMQEAKSSRAALMMLFVGAFGRFRNPESHENREFADPLEPMRELMFASRLLTIVEGRSRPPGRTGGK